MGQIDARHLIQVTRKMCEEDFTFFAAYFFHVLKRTKFQFSEHHHDIISDLTAVQRGEIQNLIENLPPRYSKTALCVVLFVAWCYVKNPKCEFIHLSYSEPLVMTNSDQIRDLIKSVEFQQLWPHIKIVPHKDSKSAWATVQGGTFYAAASGGSVTGFGAGRMDEYNPDTGEFNFSGCFPYEELIVTERGPMMIGDVVHGAIDVRVLSFNHESGKTEFMEIERHWHNPPNEIIEVQLSDGKSFRCTPDHEIFTDKGWVEASALTGEHLLLEYPAQALKLALSNAKRGGNIFARLASVKDLLVSKVVHCASIVPLSIRKIFGDASPSLPQFNLSNNGSAYAMPCGKIFGGQNALENINDRTSAKLGTWSSLQKWESTMLDRVLHVLRLSSPLKVLRPVICWFAVKMAAFLSFLLWSVKRLKDKLVYIARLNLALLGKSDSVIAMAIEGLFKYAARNWVALSRRLRNNPVKASDSSMVTDFIRTFVSKHRKPVFIRHIGHVDNTYCLQVRKNNNFILHESNVLVSNCILIDDPLKPDDARHNTIREGVNRRWDETIKSRRNSPRTPVIVIMQRIHQKDFTAMLLEDTELKWTHRKMAALIDEGLPTERALWPAKHTVEALKAMRDKKNDRGQSNPIAGEAFAGQYQQDPRPAGGGIVRDEWWRYYASLQEVKNRCTFFFITADTAYTAQESNDPSALQLWGAEGKQRMYLLDRVRGFWEFPDLLSNATKFWEKHPYAKRLYIENKASGPSLGQSIKKARTKRILENGGQVVLWKPKAYAFPEDKVGRVKLASYQIHAGLLWLPAPDIAPWVHEFVDEHSAFTENDTHAHDEDVDCETMAVSVWTKLGGGKRG